MRLRRRRSRPVKGLVAGLTSGLAATLVMSGFQAAWQKLSERGKKGTGDQGQSLITAQSQSESEPTTVKAAEAVSEGLLHHELTPEEKKVAGPAVHYVMGGVSGAIYGIMSEVAPVVTTGSGLPFGAAVWLAADEVALPVLKLTKAPTKYPVSMHAYALASHFVYGVSTDLFRRALRHTVLA